jgi:hypothetical protein
MQSTIQVSLFDIVAGCLFGSAAVFANMIYFVMIGKINERVPENERISYLWWGTEVRKRFKQLYPANKLVLLLDSSVAFMFLCFVFFMVWDVLVTR